MKIKCNAIIAGPDYRGQPGEVIDVPTLEAAQLIKAGAALPIEPSAETAASQPPVPEPPAVETAEAPAAPETAAAPAKAPKVKKK